MIHASIDKALYYVTGNGNFEKVSVKDLETLVDEYPYFGVAHLLLACKLKTEKDAATQEQVYKTAMHFPSPSWLHYQLSTDINRQPVVRFKNKPAEENKIIAGNPEALEETISASQTDEQMEGVPEPETLSTNEAISTGNLPEKEDLQSPNLEAGENDETTVNKQGEEDREQEIEEPSEILVGIEESVEKPVFFQEDVSQPDEEMAAITPATDDGVDAFLDEAEKENSLVESNEKAEPKEVHSPAEPEVLDEHETMFRNIKAMLDSSPDDDAGEISGSTIPIDPYHTVDYFASQGIKLDLDSNPDDKLGKQLKKFTHWLRHMKKLGPEDALDEISKSNDEVEIQNFANSSNTAKEVVTEAMALVLEKQGKHEKAIQLYEKLSFLNPDKRPYFADKIKNLNNN